MFNTCTIRLLDYIRLNHQVFIYKFSRICIISIDAAHLCGSKNNPVNFLSAEKIPHLMLVYQIQLVTGPGYDIFTAPLFQLPDNGRTYHTPVA